MIPFFAQGDIMTIGGEPYFFHYWWNTGDTTRFINVTQPGTYWCTVDFGCSTYTDTIHISPPPIFPLDIFNDTAICGLVNFTAKLPSGYFNYLWSTGDTTQSINITTLGNYWGQIENGCGNLLRSYFTVSIADTTTPPAPLPDIYLCDENGIVVKAPAGYVSYQWNTGDTTSSITIYTTGIYTIEMTNSCGGIFRDTFTVYNSIAEINLGNDTIICNEQFTHTLSISSSLQNILWNTGAATSSITVTEPGTYYVTAESICGIFSDTIKIDFCLPEITELLLSSGVICEGECISLNAATQDFPQTWQWSFEGGIPNNFTGQYPSQVCYNNVGNYTISLVVANNGGIDTFASTIEVLPIPIGRFEDTLISVPYKTIVNLQGCTDAQKIYWYKNDSIVCNDCETYRFEAKEWHSVYYCIAENAEGICNDTCIYKISVTDIPTDVFLPTAFSPNNDGLNDAFKVITDNPNFILHSLSVYNRWGQKIFYGTNDKIGWDGSFYGKSVENGVYYWMLRYGISGTEEKFYKKGDVTVIR